MANRRIGEFDVPPFLRFVGSPSSFLWCQLLYPAQIGIGFGCLSDAAFALLAFVNATSDSLISIERVCDATAPAKSARCRSSTPRKNHMFEL